MRSGAIVKTTGWFGPPPFLPDLAPPFSSSPTESPDAEILAVATELDVILGRGNGVNLHPGNVVFRQVTAERAHLYAQADKRELKDRIARQIALEIHRNGGRFIQPHWDSGGEGAAVWKVVSDAKALAKVKQALRDAVLSKRRKRNNASQLDLPLHQETQQSSATELLCGGGSTLHDPRVDGEHLPAQQGARLEHVTHSHQEQIGGSSFQRQEIDRKIGPSHAHTSHRTVVPQKHELTKCPPSSRGCPPQLHYNEPCDSPGTAKHQPFSFRANHSSDTETDDDSDYLRRNQQSTTKLRSTTEERSPESPIFYNSPLSDPQSAVFLSHSPSLDIPAYRNMVNQRRRRAGRGGDVCRKDPQLATKRKSPPGPPLSSRDKDKEETE